MLDLVGADFPWYGLATAVVLVAVSVFRGIRTRGAIMPAEVVFAVVVLYFLNRFGKELWTSEETHERILASALAFGVLAPVSALFWWGFRGQIRKATFLAVRFLGVAALGSWLLWRAGVGTLPALLGSAGVAVAILVLPWQSLWRSFRRARLQNRSAPSSAPATPGSENRRIEALEAAVREAQDDRKQKAAELAQLHSRILETEAHATRETAAAAERRSKLLEGVRRIRAQDRSGLAADRLHFSWHPDFGLLMAEGWRVLRAEIAAGERIPPIEHDEFFFEVISRLLSAPDSFDRYLHAQGQAIGTAIVRYTSGQAPLEPARDLTRALPSDRYAPVPVSGPDELLEAWLLPVRRYQERQLERFLAGAHPRQNSIAEHLRTEGDDLIDPEPDFPSWRAAWDEAPWVFLGVDAPAIEQRSVPSAAR